MNTDNLLMQNQNFQGYEIKTKNNGRGKNKNKNSKNNSNFSSPNKTSNSMLPYNFVAKSEAHKQMLYKISQINPGVDELIIQDIYSLINSPEIVFKLLKEAFPKNSEKHQKQQKKFEDIFKQGKPKGQLNRIRDVPLNPSCEKAKNIQKEVKFKEVKNDFWTAQNVKRYSQMFNQWGNNRQNQSDAYQER